MRFSLLSLALCALILLVRVQAISAQTSQEPSEIEAKLGIKDTPAPAGCYYQQVQCIQAPCQPQLICPTDNPPTQCSGSPDQNNDGKVNLLDYTMLVNAFKGTPQLTTHGRADINCDGLVNLKDYTLLVNAFKGN